MRKKIYLIGSIALFLVLGFSKSVQGFPASQMKLSSSGETLSARPHFEGTQVDQNQDQWTQFRHDAQHTAATPGELQPPISIRWKVGFEAWPHVFAELAVADNRVYVANTDGILTSIDADTGDIVWQVDSGAALITTPIVNGDQIYLVNIQGDPQAYARDGSALWQYSIGEGVYASPLFYEGILYLGSVGGTFYAFDPFAIEKEPIWQVFIGAMIDSAPIGMDGKIVFSAEDLHAYALDAFTGELIWRSALPGVRSWNGHPVASVKTNRVYFSVINEFFQPSSSYREVFDMFLFDNRQAPLIDLITEAQEFIAQNPERLTPAVILDAASGERIDEYSVLPTKTKISSLTFNAWYWGSIRPALWQGDKLFLQSMQRSLLLDLNQSSILQIHPAGNRNGHFVRGDEQVPISIGGNKVYGGIGGNIAEIDLRNGFQNILLGRQGEEELDKTPLTPPLIDDYDQHYLTMPGDGYTDRIGTFIVVKGRGYYQQYGWVYCFN